MPCTYQRAHAADEDDDSDCIDLTQDVDMEDELLSGQELARPGASKKRSWSDSSAESEDEELLGLRERLELIEKRSQSHGVADVFDQNGSDEDMLLSAPTSLSQQCIATQMCSRDPSKDGFDTEITDYTDTADTKGLRTCQTSETQADLPRRNNFGRDHGSTNPGSYCERPLIPPARNAAEPHHLAEEQGVRVTTLGVSVPSSPNPSATASMSKSMAVISTATDTPLDAVSAPSCLKGAKKDTGEEVRQRNKRSRTIAEGIRIEEESAKEQRLKAKALAKERRLQEREEARQKKLRIAQEKATQRLASKIEAGKFKHLEVAVSLGQFLEHSEDGGVLRGMLSTGDPPTIPSLLLLPPHPSEGLSTIKWFQRSYRFGGMEKLCELESIKAVEESYQVVQCPVLALYMTGVEMIRMWTEEEGYQSLVTRCWNLRRMHCKADGALGNPESKIILVMEGIRTSLTQHRQAKIRSRSKKNSSQDRSSQKSGASCESRSATLVNRSPRASSRYGARRQILPNRNEGGIDLLNDPDGLDKLIIRLFIEHDVEAKVTSDVEETATYLMSVTRALYSKPYRRAASEISVTRMSKAIRIAGTGEIDGLSETTLDDIWLRQIEAVPGVGESKAHKIVDTFPTAGSLLRRYRDKTKTNKEKELLLANKMGTGRTERILSRRIYRALTSDDPEEEIS